MGFFIYRNGIILLSWDRRQQTYHKNRLSTGPHTVSEPEQHQHDDTLCWLDLAEKLQPLYIPLLKPFSP